MPIIIKLQGGLGNQMFQYAFGLSVSSKLNTPFYFDCSFFHEDHGLTSRMYELDLFSNSINMADDKLINRFLHPGLVQKILKKTGLNKGSVYKENSLRFNNDVFEIKPPVYFDGFWQSERYFNNHEDLIRRTFVFKEQLNPGSPKISELIKKDENAVSIHIRRGDYVSSKSTNRLHGVCSVKYYRDAIAAIKNKISDAYFYFFSDDPDWVKENLLPLVESATLVQHNTGSDGWQDMALMSKCKHHIIANSSFSWWGAWLNPDRGKIVIAPKHWFSNETDYFNDQDIVPEDWIRLPNE